MSVENRPKIIVIIGQTASGKKKLAERLLNANPHIRFISADSRKIYKYLDIGTDKPQGALKEHFALIDIIEPCMQYSAEEFRKDAEKEIERALNTGEIPIVIGGTPLYLLALFEGFFEHKKDENVRKMLEDRLKEEGVNTLYSELRQVDPRRAKEINPNDAYRIKRALEVYYTTGLPMSEIMQYRKPARYLPVYIGIKWERKILYERINKRVDRMIENGLVEEVKKLLDMGVKENCPGMKTIGYREIIAYLKGEMSLKEAIKKVKKNTRIYARRQEYFFKHFKDVEWFEWHEHTNIIRKVTDDFERRDK